MHWRCLEARRNAKVFDFGVKGKDSWLKIPFHCSCLPGQHPRLRWNRRRRRSINLEMRFRRSNYLLRHYRELQRRNAENADYFINTMKHIEKRELGNAYRGRRRYGHGPHLELVRQKRELENRDEVHSMGDFLDVAIFRAKRDISDIERAYSKYYEKIKAKYRNYVKNLLGFHKKKINSTDADYPHEKSMKKIQVQDGRWYNSYKDPDLLNRHRVTHKARTLSKDEKGKKKQYDVNPHTTAPTTIAPPTTKIVEESVISVPHLTDHRMMSHNGRHDNNRTMNTANNFHHGHYINKQINQNNNDWERDFRNDRYSNIYPEVAQKKLNMSSMIAQLQSQIVRKKRSMKNDDNLQNRKAQKTNRRSGAVVNQTASSQMAETVDPSENIDLSKKLKFKGPCEPFPNESYIHVEFIRPSKDPAELYGPGTIIRITCDKGYISSVQNPNATSKCVRGRWKPIKPICSMSEYGQCFSCPLYLNCFPLFTESCFVPSTEHGKYLTIPRYSAEGMKPTPSPVIAMEQVDNGQTIAFQCDEGYNIQVSFRRRGFNRDSFD